MTEVMVNKPDDIYVEREGGSRRRVTVYSRGRRADLIWSTASFDPWAFGAMSRRFRPREHWCTTESLSAVCRVEDLTAIAFVGAMMKVHIIGLPSAGKTTLAAGTVHTSPRTAVTPSTPWRSWTNGGPCGQSRSVTCWLLRYLASPGFVTEGGFVGWVTPLFAAADRIVWLDPPLRVLIWRHVRRHGRLFQPQWLIARVRFQVLCYTRAVGEGPAKDAPDQTRSGIEVALQPWADKVLRLRRPATVAEVIEELRLLP